MFFHLVDEVALHFKQTEVRSDQPGNNCSSLSSGEINYSWRFGDLCFFQGKIDKNKKLQTNDWLIGMSVPIMK
jgi:hypothetical protein